MKVLKNIEKQIIEAIESESMGNGCGKVYIDRDGIYIVASYNMYSDYCSCEVETAVRVINEELDEWEAFVVDTDYITQRLYSDIRDGEAEEETEYLLSMSF